MGKGLRGYDLWARQEGGRDSILSRDTSLIGRVNGAKIKVFRLGRAAWREGTWKDLQTKRIRDSTARAAGRVKHVREGNTLGALLLKGGHGRRNEEAARKRGAGQKSCSSSKKARSTYKTNSPKAGTRKALRSRGRARETDRK